MTDVVAPPRPPEPVERARPRWACWRSPAGDPGWARPVLLAVAAVAAVTYAWGTAGRQPEIYYAAAVRSMASNWHNFFFGAFDPAGTISVDKLPGALWLQALSVRVFGLHIWALNLPQVVEGTLTVPVLYRAVRRLAGVPAATVAVLVYACMPATVGLDRGNVSDSLLILLLVCATDALGAALRNGSVRPLLYAGGWVGLAFQAKMLQAWLVLPAFVLVWVLAGAPALGRRVLGAGALVGVAVAVSVSWSAVVSAVPAHDRPYVDGSTHDSVFEQVFEYNGLSRADARSAAGPASGPASVGAFVAAVTLDTGSRADRTVAGAGGRAIGWLLPMAAGGLLLGLVGSRGRPRSDPLRAASILWGTWLVLDLAAFSLVSTLNAYYLAALTPPVAALTGIGAAVAWRSPAGRVRAGAAVLAAATVLYGWWLLAPSPAAVRWTVLVVAAGLCVLAAVGRRLGVAAALAAALVAPAVAAVALVYEGGGPFTTPFEPAADRYVTQGQVAAVVRSATSAVTKIRAANAGARYPAAAYTSLVAAPLIFGTGIEVLPIGGFTGATPSPTVGQLAADIRAGDLHTVLLTPARDARAAFLSAHCLAVRSDVAGLHIYYCR